MTTDQIPSPAEKAYRVYEEPWPLQCPICEKPTLKGPIEDPFCGACGWNNHLQGQKEKEVIKAQQELIAKMKKVIIERHDKECSLAKLIAEAEALE